MTITSVLCAVDISNENRDLHVMKVAARMARLDGAQLDVITVVPDFGMSVVANYFEDTHHEKAATEARRRLGDLVTSALGAEADSKIRHLVASGNAYEAILQAAKSAGTDLIVIGAHKPDFADYLLGPNAARVVRHSNCSVYVVR